MANRTGPSGRGRHVDSQRKRRGGSLPPLGTGLTYDKSDRITVEAGRSLPDLGMTVSETPTQTEVQAILDGYNALLAVLRDANQIKR